MAGENDKWEFYQAKDGWRWRRTATNGEVVGAATEGYVNRGDCIANAQRHGYESNPQKLGGADKWEFYEDKKGEWRWRRTARNGNNVGASTEGYTSKSSALANAQRNGYTGS